MTLKRRIIFVPSTRDGAPLLEVEVATETVHQALRYALGHLRLSGVRWTEMFTDYRKITVVTVGKPCEGCDESSPLKSVEIERVFPLNNTTDQPYLEELIEEVEMVWLRKPPPELEEPVPSDEELAYRRGENIFPEYEPEEVM